MRKNIKVEIFNSFEDENNAEYKRRAKMTPQQRCDEFAVLQERAWGEKWISEPFIRTATWERFQW